MSHGCVVCEQIELMKVEGMQLSFSPDAIREIAKVAAEVNRTVENIGARRLHTVVEKIMEDISYNASERKNTTLEVTPVYVNEAVKDFLRATDLKKYII